MIIPRYYEDLSVLHDNTMPPRAYYIPASKRMNDLVEHREKSDRFYLLSGEWKFRYKITKAKTQGLAPGMKPTRAMNFA